MTNTRALFTGVGMGALIACIALAPHARAIGTDCSTLPCLGDPPRRPAITHVADGHTRSPRSDNDRWWCRRHFLLCEARYPRLAAAAMAEQRTWERPR